jgi:hypothetical protein
MKITIILEDTFSGHVKVHTEPSFESIVARRMTSKQPFTPAENYAFLMANAVREASRKLDKYDPRNSKQLGSL